MTSGFVDIHHHLLHGMDDGPQSFEETVQMLHHAVKQGVRHVAATPHIRPGQTEFDVELYRRRLMDARGYARENNLPIRIWSGSEVFYTSMTEAFLRQGRIPTLGGGWHVLVEFEPQVGMRTIVEAADRIGNLGYTMVLAHAERYRSLYVGKRLARLKDDYRIMVQVNADTLMNTRDVLRSGWIRHMLREDIVDIVASDAHGVRQRACSMARCAEEIARLYGEKKARQLCADNAMAVLNERAAIGKKD